MADNLADLLCLFSKSIPVVPRTTKAESFAAQPREKNEAIALDTINFVVYSMCCNYGAAVFLISSRNVARI